MSIVVTGSLQTFVQFALHGHLSGGGGENLKWTFIDFNQLYWNLYRPKKTKSFEEIRS